MSKEIGRKRKNRRPEPIEGSPVLAMTESRGIGGRVVERAVT